MTLLEVISLATALGLYLMFVPTTEEDTHGLEGMTPSELRGRQDLGAGLPTTEYTHDSARVETTARLSSPGAVRSFPASPPKVRIGPVGTGSRIGGPR